MSQFDDNDTPENESYLSKEALEALETERLTMGESEATMAARLFRQELVSSAYSICHMAKYGVNERLRYEAAKYVVERNLGRLQDTNALDTEDPFDELLANCVISVEEDEATRFASKVLGDNPDSDENI